MHGPPIAFAGLVASDGAEGETVPLLTALRAPLWPALETGAAECTRLFASPPFTARS